MVSVSILYFVGLMIKRLINEGKYALEPVGEGRYEVNVFFAGNGSRLFEWILIHGDKSTSIKGSNGRDKVNNLLASYVRDALKGTKRPDDIEALDIENVKVNIFNSNYPKHESACGILYVRSEKEEDTSNKFDIVDIDSLIYQYSLEDKDKFKGMLVDSLEVVRNAGMKIDKSKEEFRDLRDDKKYEYLTKVINPDFTEANVAAVIRDFLEAFAIHSPTDFDRLFSGIINKEIQKCELNDIELEKIEKEVGGSLHEMMKPVRGGKDDVLPLSVRAFNGYAVLKYATYKLK